MRCARVAVWLFAAACYNPSPPSGAPCSPSGQCPGNQQCIDNVCGGTARSDAPLPPPDGPLDPSIVVLGMNESQVRDVALSNLPGEADEPLGRENHFSVDTEETGLVWFDTAVVPPLLRVTRATLTLFTLRDSFAADNGTVTLHRVLEPWVEAEATWIRASAGLEWKAPGAGPGSRVALDLEVTPNKTESAFPVDLPLDVVQGWIDEPAKNFGLAIVKGSTSMHVHFAARENVSFPAATLTLHLAPAI